MTLPNSSLYRPCAGIMLLNRENLVFIGRRRSRRPHHSQNYDWQMPQGGIDPGESPLAAALRELHEETNVSSVHLLAEAPGWYTYDLPTKIHHSPWQGRFKGQSQKWFAFRFEGSDSEINIDYPPNQQKAEFEAWRWEHMSRLPELIIPFKRPVYEQVVAAFSHLIL